MNKIDIIEHIARSADISKAAAGRALEATIAAVKLSLKKDGEVTLVGFGTFYVAHRAARKGTNEKFRLLIRADRQCQAKFISKALEWGAEAGIDNIAFSGLNRDE